VRCKLQGVQLCSENVFVAIVILNGVHAILKPQAKDIAFIKKNRFSGH